MNTNTFKVFAGILGFMSLGLTIITFLYGAGGYQRSAEVTLVNCYDRFRNGATRYYYNIAIQMEGCDTLYMSRDKEMIGDNCLTDFGLSPHYEFVTVNILSPCRLEEVSAGVLFLLVLGAVVLTGCTIYLIVVIYQEKYREEQALRNKVEEAYKESSGADLEDGMTH